MPDPRSVVSKIGLPAEGVAPALYAWAFVGVQIFFLLFVLFLSSTPWFLTHDAYPGAKQSGYGMRLKHADCDVVIYGDSSSLTGLDPDIIQSLTGLTACNISEGGSIQGVVGSRVPLDAYLSNNRRPRYLLAMYTPSSFTPYTPPFHNYQPDGVLYLLQYDRSRKMLFGLLRQRGWAVKYDLWAGHQIIQDFLDRYFPSKTRKPVIDTRAQRDSRHGIWPFPLPAETQCVRQTFHLDPASFGRHADSVAEMRSIYGAGGTTVLINIAPVPTCDALQQTYRTLAEGLHDNEFETLPISDFNSEDVHFTAEGSRHISIEAANQILALERQRKSGVSSPGMAAEHPE